MKRFITYKLDERDKLWIRLEGYRWRRATGEETSLFLRDHPDLLLQLSWDTDRHGSRRGGTIRFAA